MFTFENDEARDIIINAEDSYEKTFDDDFPTYLEVPNVVTVKAAKEFEQLVNRHIKENKPYIEPSEAEEKLY